MRQAIGEPDSAGAFRCSSLSAAVVMLAGSGLRIGELLGLNVEDVDFLRRTVRVERQRLQDGRVAPPKTPQSVRTVPLGDLVVRELTAMLAQRSPKTGPLFASQAGHRLPRGAWIRAWGRAQAATDLDFDTHDLRHFYAWALLSGGASMKRVETSSGHSSAVVTVRVYAHLWPGDRDRTRAISDAALAPLADNLRTSAFRSA